MMVEMEMLSLYVCYTRLLSLVSSCVANQSHQTNSNSRTIFTGDPSTIHPHSVEFEVHGIYDKNNLVAINHDKDEDEEKIGIQLSFMNRFSVRSLGFILGENPYLADAISFNNSIMSTFVYDKYVQ